MSDAPEPNAAQARHWNVEAGPSWVETADQHDAMLEPFLAALIDMAEPTAGERALDIGCGCGATTIALAQAVGPGGTVLGIDVSAPMLDRARERIDALGLANVTFQQADAQETTIPASHDLAISRFGVMFFDDPVAAFANIGRGLRAGGRLTFVCWQELRRNPWMKVPIDAVLPFVPAPPPTDPHAPGPYAFADRDRTHRILAEAGFTGVSIEPFEGQLALGGTSSLDVATAFAARTGALRNLLGSADAAALAAALEAVRDALAPYAGADGVRIDFAAWAVSASQRGMKGQG